jgi:hypothetical protein
MFICRYCGKERPWEEKDYDMGYYLAEQASLDALGHGEHVTPYLICEECSEEIKEELSISGWADKEG